MCMLMHGNFHPRITVRQIRGKDNIPTASRIPGRWRATGNPLPFRRLSLHIATRNSKDISRGFRPGLISEYRCFPVSNGTQVKVKACTRARENTVLSFLEFNELQRQKRHLCRFVPLKMENIPTSSCSLKVSLNSLSSWIFL
ncbi:uncharacterized protein LOC112460754 isoform X2 [Temnothorax curvispinosus]|uniref:Uncharacterized protein LOC112460754 isoform X1 n=1 Tax=Temnothorax curvispinosus TaxID=300111 RepID=A0A6J1QG93_9HYME|nr:uncharacterized protein LOC112460754 isoform X1 [Temnothorax curvispinosus]XP_024881347.1 uncharacterized protein LOC112460754 isoform X2 [Temnothorax curvispinosus]